MVYSKYYEGVVGDKNGFFATVQTTADAYERARNEEHGFDFLAPNKDLIEKEFNQLFATLKKKAVKNEGDAQKFWLYCYYCCLMLQNYYAMHQEPGKADHYANLAESIRQRCGNEVIVVVADDTSFLKKLGNNIAASLKEIIDTPFSVSKIISNVGFANVSRIYWAFCRLTMKNSLFLARELQWLGQLGNVLGKEIDVDAIVHTWEKPNHIFRALSVGFFAARFILNAGIVLKHTLTPSDGERALSTWQRFKNEVYERHAVFINDLVWGTVNGLTNYNEVFGISASVAGWTTAGFLLFDVCLLLYRRHLAEGNYLIKKAQYESECRAHEKLLTQPGYHAQAAAILREQIKQLDNSWEIESSTYLFNATGALLLMMGFSASMLFTPAALVVGSYMVCTLGVSIYLSDGAYNNYKTKNVALRDARLEQDEETSPIAMKFAEWEADVASADFYSTLGKNALLPSVFMATMAVCWPAAVVMTAGYAVYSLSSSYNRHNQEKAMQLELNSVDKTESQIVFAM